MASPSVLDTILRAQQAQRAYYRRTDIQLALGEEPTVDEYMQAEPLEPIPPGHCEGGGPTFTDEDYEMPPGWFQPDGTPHETISEQVNALRRAGAYKRN